MTITQNEDGYVNISSNTTNPKTKHALVLLEDGLSYLGYALKENDMGLNDPKKDMGVAVDFIDEALKTLKG